MADANSNEVEGLFFGGRRIECHDVLDYDQRKYSRNNPLAPDIRMFRVEAFWAASEVTSHGRSCKLPEKIFAATSLGILAQ